MPHLDFDEGEYGKTWRSGYAAFKAGKSLQDNTHPADSFHRRFRAVWAVGWKDAKSDKRDDEKAAVRNTNNAFAAWDAVTDSATAPRNAAP